MHYYYAINTGKGFITYEDNSSSLIMGYPGNIWVTENIAWAERVGAEEKTKEEAQDIVNNAILYDPYPTDDDIDQDGEHNFIILP